MACDAGLIGPVGGFFADIPYPIVGGMVTFLFANVMVSGIIVLSKLGIKRRNRIILSFSLGIALGVAMQAPAPPPPPPTCMPPLPFPPPRHLISPAFQPPPPPRHFHAP